MAYQMLKLTPQGAIRRGFPINPAPGQRIVDPQTGLVFTWMGAGEGVGDLGFWGALISAAIGIGTSLFSGGGKKEAQKALAEQDAIIKQQQQMIEGLKERELRQERKTALRITTKELPIYLALAAGAYFLLSK